MALIFQYGSNCNAARLNAPERLGGAALDRGLAQTVEEYDIAFNVWSNKNACAASSLVPAGDAGRYAWGVLYDIPSDRLRGTRTDGLRSLEQIEGPRYEEKTIRVRNSENEEIGAITFVVRTADRGLWTSAQYVGHIVNGLRGHNAPEGYVQHVIDVAIETNRRAPAPG